LRAFRGGREREAGGPGSKRDRDRLHGRGPRHRATWPALIRYTTGVLLGLGWRRSQAVDVLQRHREPIPRRGVPPDERRVDPARAPGAPQGGPATGGDWVLAPRIPRPCRRRPAPGNGRHEITGEGGVETGGGPPGGLRAGRRSGWISRGEPCG